MPPASVAVLTRTRRAGLLWVAASPLGRPVGFALMAESAGAAWLDQLSVLDRWQGRGLGRALIERTAQEARQRGYRALLLSTYRDVPWNAPYYARRGFVEWPLGAWDGPTRRQMARANAHGHPSWRRCVMIRALD